LNAKLVQWRGGASLALKAGENREKKEKKLKEKV